MPDIPIVIHVTGAEFDALERIAGRRGTSIRELISSHVRAGLNLERVVRPTTRFKSRDRPVGAADIDEWVALAETGVTNNEIAARAGVSKSLVSRHLIERGVRRRTRNGGGQSA